MPRPKNKSELKKISEKNFQKMFEIINSLTEDQKQINFFFEDRDKNIRDILVHLL